ncbi:MAG: ABC transporter permease [Candidatus Zipacnadales bacterium]
MFALLAEAWRARELLWVLTEREIKTRYRRSFLGLLWSLMTPLYEVALMTVVVKLIWKQPDDNYSIKFLCGLLPWTFFASALPTACNSIIRARDMVKRVPMPRQVLPWAVVGSCMFHFLASLGVLMILLLLIPVHFTPTFLFLPVLMLIELVMVGGLSLITATLHTFYQDVEFIVANLIRAFFFLTPVMWRVDRPWVTDPERQFLIMLNPMAVFCEGFRRAILEGKLPSGFHIAVATGVSLLCLIGGLWYFNRRQWQLPEVV